IGLALYFFLHPYYSRVQHERSLAVSYVKQHYQLTEAGRTLRMDALSQNWNSWIALAHCNLFSEHCYRVWYGFNAMEGGTLKRVRCEWLVKISDQRSWWKLVPKADSIPSDNQFDFRPESRTAHVSSFIPYLITATPTNTEARMLFVSDLLPNLDPVPKDARTG